jgi:preprotein translocase SecF subunit
MQFFHGTKIDFMKTRTLFFYISLVLTISSVLTVAITGVDFGIDFTGGSELAVKFDKVIHTDEIRGSIERGKFHGAEIKSYGEENQFLIRMRESGKAAERAIDVLRNDFPNNKIELLKTDTIGPKVGKELFNMGILAVILAVIAIMLYIAFRFEFKFGLGAIVALVHDVVVAFGIVNLVHHLGIINIEFNQNMIAAMLTVVGYSVNDTVIVFDRVRENMEKHKGLHFVKLINLSINETLSRTINTVLTVVIVLLIIVLFGGPVLQGFAFTMLVGITFGTYSSVYVASAFVVWYLRKVKKIEVDDPADAKLASSKI